MPVVLESELEAAGFTTAPTYLPTTKLVLTKPNKTPSTDIGREADRTPAGYIVRDENNNLLEAVVTYQEACCEPTRSILRAAVKWRDYLESIGADFKEEPPRQKVFQWLAGEALACGELADKVRGAEKEVEVKSS